MIIMRTKEYKVNLREEQRGELQSIIATGKHSAKKIRRANILLLLDENSPPVKKRMEIAEICHTSEPTVLSVAKRFCAEGMEAALNRRKRAESPIRPIVTGEIEAHIIAINCSEPPKGHKRWTLTLTAEKLVELHIVPAISRDTVGRVLKKRIKTPSQ
jgi:hypothetical protein